MPFRPRPLIMSATGATALVVLALTGCVPNAQPGDATITVRITDDACEVSTATAVAGNVTFALISTGSDVNEFEILGDDKLRIVGEKENVVPDATTSYTVQLEPGTYYTACKFQMTGPPIGLAEFTVTGEAAGPGSGEQALIDEAVENYIGYVKSQAGELIPAVAAFADAYAAGDDQTARDLFASTRVFYERIEPTAEAFGDLDPKIDYREVDAVAAGLEWTGFHRMEKDLWPPAAGSLNSDGTSAFLDWAPSTPDERATLAEQLVTDVQALYDLVDADDFSITLADISNGAISLLDEVAVGKITGEEDWWSHTDLTDFAGNVQGAAVAFGNVKAIAVAAGDEGSDLADEIQQRFDGLEALLAQYGSVEAGFTPYDTVTDAQRRELSDGVNALAEPLSLLTSTVLGV
ncbi:MAG: iron uptake system protein EfeO [Pseudolysinimonas sp.]